MKKLMSISLICAILCCCVASATAIEILLKPNTECINYGLNELSVATYTDEESKVYVSLEDLMLALNGTYALEDGKITITLDKDNLPSIITIEETVIEPSTSWTYVKYYFQQKYGDAWDEEIEDVFSNEIILLLDKAIQKNVDTDALLEALDELACSGGGAHHKLDDLIK